MLARKRENEETNKRLVKVKDKEETETEFRRVRRGVWRQCSIGTCLHLEPKLCRWEVHS